MLGATAGSRLGARMSLFFRLQPESPLEDPASPGWESLLLIVQTQFLCDGAVRTKNCVWTSVAEVPTPPAGLREDALGQRRKDGAPGLGHGKVTGICKPGEALARVSRKLNKHRWREGSECVKYRPGPHRDRAGTEGPTGPELSAAPRPCGSSPGFPPAIYLSIALKSRFHFIQRISALGRGGDPSAPGHHHPHPHPPPAAAATAAPAQPGHTEAAPVSAEEGTVPAARVPAKNGPGPAPPAEGCGDGAALSGWAERGPGQSEAKRLRRPRRWRRGFQRRGFPETKAFHREAFWLCKPSASAGAAKETREEEGSITRSERNFTKSLSRTKLEAENGLKRL